MKRALLIPVFAFSIGLLPAQTCTRVLSTWVAAQGGYPIYGTATMVEQPDSTILLTLDNAFSTTSGPDLHLFLSTTNASPTSPNSVNYLIGPLQMNFGSQTYTIPDSISITQYDYLLIHCVMYNHFWGGGMFGNCILSVADNPELNELRAYPNPSYGKFFLEDVKAGTTITVYNLAGSKVFEEENPDYVSNYTLDLTTHPVGMYILQVTAGNVSCRKKLVIYR
jgi:hypothetical protein